MMIGFEMFLLAAEEMNMTRAAERAFVTQQCLSDHIRRLEESYHVRLFWRKPKLALTPEGEAMVRYLTKIRVLEEGMQKELCDINAGVRGTLNFGIGTTRGEILVPMLVEAIRENAPQVDFQVVLGDTRDLEQQLLSGKLDIILGVSTERNSMLRYKSIQDEQLYLIIPVSMFQHYFPENNELYRKNFEHGVDLRFLPDLPLVLGHESSRTALGVRQYYRKNNLDIHIPVAISGFSINLRLCRSGKYATVAPYMHLYQLFEDRQYRKFEEKLLVFPILNIEHEYRIEIVTHKDVPPLQLVKTFSRVLESCCHTCYHYIDDYINTVNHI